MRLKTITSIALAFGFALVGAASVLAAESAGKVLVAVGDNVATRSGRDVRLAAGSVIESGDTLKVGDNSNMQVRFTDGGIVALRPNTVFNITEYKFANQVESDKSIFNLLKGGFRTITGIIGHARHENYSVKTETATIGIRGTHYVVVTCNGDCNLPDGKKAPNGTYGSVIDGLIAATNNAGQREFGRDEYFHVASVNSLPERIMAPPAFLRDRLAGAGRKQGQASGLAGTTGSSSSSGGDSQLIGSTTPPGAAPPITTIVTTLPVALTNATVTLPASFDLVLAYNLGGSYTVTMGGINLSSGSFFYADTGAFSSQTPSSVAAASTSAYSGATSSPWTVGTTVQYQGNSAAAGNVYWGTITPSSPNWIPPGYSSSCSGGYCYNYAFQWGPMHWAFGDPATNVPTQGSATYNWVGGTNPTNALGQVGSVVNGGVMLINYGSQTVTSTTPLTYSVGGTTFTITATNAPYGAGAGPNPYYTGSAVTATTNGQSTSSSCGGAGCTVYTSGRFTGANAAGGILGVATQPYQCLSGSCGQYATSTVQVYRK